MGRGLLPLVQHCPKYLNTVSLIVETFLVSSDNQFCFKKVGVGCGYAIKTVRGIVDNYMYGKRQYSQSLCIDISKAFDRVNHFALLIKLMKRLLPVQLLYLLENWLLTCFSCVKWALSFSQFF